MVKMFRRLVLFYLCFLMLSGCSKKQDSEVESTVPASAPVTEKTASEPPSPAKQEEGEQEEEKKITRIIKSYTARSWMKSNIYPYDFDIGTLSVESELSLKERNAVNNTRRFIRAVRKADGSAETYVEENASDAVLSLIGSFNTSLWSFGYYSLGSRNEEIFLTLRINEGEKQILAEIHFNDDMKITLFELYYRPEKEGVYYPGSFSGAPSFF